MAFIDEYKAPNNCAYELGFLAEVHLSCPSQLWSKLTAVIQTNEFFGCGVLPALLKVTII